uniref:Uncharacterized protein isoform X2 n=1 Tax=Nicotiana tabacum TaxID=4097 RepID=A0A1S4CFY7_TOBAC|nr:PREDICTED: uncharacterized protein LOC107818538 isoform X2 [Nicotiana tabacum]
MGKNGFIREEAEERRKASISHSDTSAAARQLQPHQYTAVVGLSPACQILPLFSSQGIVLIYSPYQKRWSTETSLSWLQWSEWVHCHLGCLLPNMVRT